MSNDANRSGVALSDRSVQRDATCPSPRVTDVNELAAETDRLQTAPEAVDDPDLSLDDIDDDTTNGQSWRFVQGS